MSQPGLEPATGAGPARFEFLAEIGRGAMGIVYRARDHAMGIDVALKTLPVRDSNQLYLLKNEFRLLADIVDPHLVNLYELVVDDARCFFTMELLDGRHFDRALRAAGGAVDPARVRGAARQLVSGLEVLHQRGRLHRDVKPSNVLIAADGRVVLLDFGLATVFGGDDDRRRTLADAAGTLAYIAPEVAWGATASPAADLYSVGVMLFEVLAGRLPYEGTAGQVVTDKMNRAAPRLRDLVPEVPADLDALVAALLEREPGGRPDAAAISAHLANAASGSAPAGAGARPYVPERPFVGRAAELAALGAAFDALRDGRPALAEISGQSGIGKSELARRFLGWVAAERDAVVLRGRCHPHEAVPYNALDALVDDLSRYLVGQPDAARAALAPRHGAQLARLFPVLGRVPGFLPEVAEAPDAEAFELRRRGVAALRDLLARLADRAPLVLWIDDAQWGDADSAALLGEILRPPDAPALMLVLTHRGEEGVAAPLLAGLRALDPAAFAAAPRLALAPMDADDAAQLVRLLAPPEIAAHAGAIVQEAGGSPFFLGQIVRHLRGERGAHGRPHLADVVDDRMRELPAQARGVLEVVAVAARPTERSIVLAAAGMGEAGRPLIVHLETHGFVRQAPRDDGRIVVEAYHDRIREAVMGQLPAERLRSCHGQLAAVLEGLPQVDPEALFRHHLGAGHDARAAGWGVRAADRAAAALAFGEAAELYRRALELKAWGPDEAVALQTGRAEALANAGRAAEAAPVFLAVSRMVTGTAAVEFRRRAAQQHLISGRVDDGVAIFRPLLRELGLPYPAGPRSAMLGVVGRLLRLRARGINFSARPAATPSAEKLLRVDTCIAAGLGLVAVDTAVGGYLSLVGLQEALRVGEPVRVGRGLAIVGGAVLVPAGGPLARWGKRMIDSAERLARETNDPYLDAAVHLSRGQAAVVQGDWRAALDHNGEAVSRFRAGCRGVTWETTLARSGLLRALEETGDFDTYAREADALAAEAAQLGDRYGEMTAALYVGIARIARDDVPAARAALRAALGRWSQAGFQLQHFYAMRGETVADLYEGRPREAWARLEAVWPELRRSVWLRVPITRIDAWLLRARVALALASAQKDRQRSDALGVCRVARDRLMREGRLDTAAHATQIDAELAHIAGRADDARRQYAAAAGQFRAAAMPLQAACCCVRSIPPDDASAVAEATAALAATGIRNPSRWLRVATPG